MRRLTPTLRYVTLPLLYFRLFKSMFFPRDLNWLFGMRLAADARRGGVNPQMLKFRNVTLPL